MRPRSLARLGPTSFGCARFPDLEDAAEAHEHHGVGQAGKRNQRIRQDDAAFLVGVDRERIRIQRCSQVVVLRTEQIEPVQRFLQGLELRCRPSLDAGMLVLWAQHQVRSVAVGLAV